MLSKVCLAVCLCSAISLLPGATIISATFPPGGSSAIYALQAVWVSWSQNISYDNVAITADLSSGSQGATGTAYLTNAIGPGANSSNLLGTTNYSLQPSDPGLQNTSLFSGLTLGPGTYYVTLWSPCFFNCSGGNWISAEDHSHVTMGNGVTNNGGFVEHGINASFPPATDYTDANFGNFPLQSAYQVTGTAITSIPEPGTLGGLTFGIAYHLLRRPGASRVIGALTPIIKFDDTRTVGG